MNGDPGEQFPPLGTLIRGYHNGRWTYGIVISHRLIGDEWHFRCFWADDGKADMCYWSPIRFRLGYKSKMHPWTVVAFLPPVT